jgi:phosphoglycerate dehydrogenase-like enzyme
MDNTTPVAVLSRSFSRNPVLRQELSARFGNVRFNDEGKSLGGQELVDFLNGIERVIVALEKIDDSVLSQLPDLKIIGKYGVGCDSIDLPACSKRGVKVGWMPGVNRFSVAELALSFIIGTIHRVGEGYRQVLDGGWTQLAGRNLAGKTVGIIGLGHVGAELARLLAPFRCEILAYDVRDRGEIASLFNVKLVSMEELLERSAVVSLHVPSTNANYHLLSRERIQAMAPGAIVINTARGGLIDEDALYDALSAGRLGGAALDVYENEPPVKQRALVELPNVISTPHIGGSTSESVLAMGRAAIAGLDNAVEALTVLPDYMRD